MYIGGVAVMELRLQKCPAEWSRIIKPIEVQMISDKNEWPPVSPDARILYSLLFYSQGPVDGYLIGEKARDFFLHSGLPLPTLSQIWNLADISNDNLLTVEEFILTMYFCHGALQGKKLPRSLSAALRPPEKSPVSLPFLTQEEKIIFSKIFEAIDVNNTGFIEGSTAKVILTATGVNTEELKIIWDLSDINRDGRLDYGEWTVACQLIKLIKQGQSLDVPINVFTNLPERIAPGSLQAGKKRVAEYEERKQKLMKLKERRRLQSEREKKRLELTQKKVALLTQVYDVLEKENSTQLPELQKKIADDRENIEKQEIIVYRLKKEHEKVRQETVKIILDEQKVSSDIKQIKEQTDELNKTLRSSHSKATKDPDPFHQLYEERKGIITLESQVIFNLVTHCCKIMKFLDVMITKILRKRRFLKSAETIISKTVFGEIISRAIRS
ncbi:hypothetical protein LOTGIDRAFT_165884 [Lottia gigantea]|uniref:Uncharacterized protein n=1 Tax=Lottia gigantea TaxID=225164 RepID=V4BHI2_LOTGI|nr:hypothetical protein LOTGIDRAFT_165884 [Lottia gigantea]ESO88144.1 hypothetical protein LOTGIDRAFT_165884 [Lottia gigantea]